MLGFYVLLGQLSRGQGFWEIVPGSLYDEIQDLQQQVQACNPAEDFDLRPTSGGQQTFRYRLAVSEDVLEFHFREGEPNRCGIREIRDHQGVTLDQNDVHFRPGDPKRKIYPLLDVREVDERFRFTGIRYALAPGDGLVEINNPWVDERLLLDSRDVRHPTRATRTVGTLRIVVHGIVGRDTCPIEDENQTLDFHIENMRVGPLGESRRATVSNAVDDVGLPRRELGEGDVHTIRLSGSVRRVTLRAEHDRQQTQRVIHLDYAPPRFREILVSSSPRRPGVLVLSAEGVQDDGYCDTTDYLTTVEVDGRGYPEVRGLGISLTDLTTGRHRATMWISDGCGRQSDPRSVEFTSDTEAPVLQFVRPGEDDRIRHGSELNVVLQVEDPTGIVRVRLYVDRVSNSEFDNTQIRYRHSGSTETERIGFGRPERVSFVIDMDEIPGELARLWGVGSHKLIATAEDYSGNVTTVEPRIQIVRD